MNESQNPHTPPMAPSSMSDRRPVAFASLLWIAFAAAAVVDVLYIGRTRSLFEAMYEGLGTGLPAASRFFLNSLWHLAALAAVPVLALLAGIAWRVRAWAGIAVLLLAVALTVGWGLAYRWAMRLPIVTLEHEFDSGR